MTHDKVVLSVDDLQEAVTLWLNIKRPDLASGPYDLYIAPNEIYLKPSSDNPDDNYYTVKTHD